MRLSSKIDKIKKLELTIDDEIEKKYYLTNQELQKCLSDGLLNKNLSGLPLRTRSKRIKEIIAESIGYAKPKSFKRAKPAFKGQNFDVYSNKSNNLQVWNQSICLDRRYVIIKLNKDSIIVNLAVIDGIEISKLDSTGTQTHKIQARLINKNIKLFCSLSDTQKVQLAAKNISLKVGESSGQDNPTSENLIPIDGLFNILKSLIGTRIPDIGKDQDRVRGGLLQKLVSETLGYKNYRENGQFPDIKNQLLEVKFQTSPTVDLGWILPSEKQILDGLKIQEEFIEYCDVRYAVFYGEYFDNEIVLSGLYLVSGEDFFTHFKIFKGKNSKIQMSIASLFDS